MTELRHDEVEELLGAYALDAVDADEAAEVEAHLATCPRCRAEVDAHREVAAHLAQSGAPAPEQLWDRIADAIEGEAPPPMRLVLDRPAARLPKSLLRWGGLSLAAAAAVLVVALAAGGGDSGGDGTELEDAALAAFQSPDAATADLVDGDGVALARAALLPDGTGYLLADALPDLDGTVYQLWGSDGTTVVSLGVLGPDPDVVGFHADPAHEVLMITEEDEAVARTDNQPLAVGQLA